MPTTVNTRAVRFHAYGKPVDVLRLEAATLDAPAPGHIRVKVHACGLNPADWTLCRPLFPNDLPRGIGLDDSGTVDALGEGVTDVKVGDLVFGAADYARSPSAGLADYAILTHWTLVPPGLDLTAAAALPMAIETAQRGLEGLGVKAGDKLLVSGAGTVIGFAAVQMGLLRGAQVFATAGPTYADKLRELGAKVTSYGEGLAGRVRELAGGDVDRVLDTAPPSGALPALVEAAGHRGQHVLSISDWEGAKAAGARDPMAEKVPMQYAAYAPFAKLAAEGKFLVPVARTYPLERWREAMEASMSGKAHGKIIVMP
jgi:NADPH:quinone reductase-like Zn-dependent oxidoreductase